MLMFPSHTLYHMSMRLTIPVEQVAGEFGNVHVFVQLVIGASPE